MMVLDREAAVIKGQYGLVLILVLLDDGLGLTPNVGIFTRSNVS